MIFRRFAVLAFLATTLRAWGDDAQTKPVTRVPQGTYAVVRLDLTEGLQDAKEKETRGPQRLFIGLRDGRLANLWFVRPMAGDRRLAIETSSVVLQDNLLAGTAQLRTAINRGAPQVDLKLVLRLTLQGDKIAGDYEIVGDQSPYRSVQGKALGERVSSAPVSEGLAPEASWTSFWGTNGNMSAQSQPPLLEDIARARPVWRSETVVPTGYGNAPDSRYFTRALVAGNGGGGSSPVVAGNTVYMHFHVPSPDSPPTLGGSPYWERSYKDDADFKAKMAALNASEREIGLVMNHFRPLADDHVVAIDAATGAEKWRTILPLRSPNLQTHKHRGISGVPLIAGDTLFVPNLMSRIYALDAKSGALKWESPAFSSPEKSLAVSPPLNPSPLLAGGHLIFGRGGKHQGTVVALDPATGAERWKAPGSYVLRWTNGGRERLITLTGLQSRTMTCIDAVEGRTLWSRETPLDAVAPLSAVVAGDMLVAAPPAARGGPNVVRYEGWRLSDTGASPIWQDADLPVDENVPLTVMEGRVYLQGRQEIRVLDAVTGKQIAERKFERDGPGSNPWLGVVGDRLLFLPEGQHGTARLRFLDPQLKDLGSPWLPSNVDTTAYNSQPIIYPVVDGRVFIRGGDGIYCYDLRKP